MDITVIDRAAGGKRRCGLPRYSIEDVRQESRHALMMDRDRFNIVGVLVHGIDDANIPMSAKAEMLGHFFADQLIDYDLAAVE